MSEFGAYVLKAYQCKQLLNPWELLKIPYIITCVAQLLGSCQILVMMKGYAL
ncbi:hypothetical protein NIES22_72270 (plasmid) [Calothrix brevissima NIES-22]|nr:hypothetical protein NIES22_72270 [Calothrix brevissima NIES-22]